MENWRRINWRWSRSARVPRGPNEAHSFGNTLVGRPIDSIESELNELVPIGRIKVVHKQRGQGKRFWLILNLSQTQHKGSLEAHTTTK